MHELSIIENIFKALQEVAREKNLAVITKVTIKIGRLRQVVPEFLQFAFATVAKNTLAESSKLEIKFVPITVLCKHCQNKFTVEENAYVCENCGSVDLEILTGKEIELESIEGETKCK